eukprot:359828-Chlamydomonas_euryale.AAC.5
MKNARSSNGSAGLEHSPCPCFQSNHEDMASAAAAAAKILMDVPLSSRWSLHTWKVNQRNKGVDWNACAASTKFNLQSSRLWHAYDVHVYSCIMSFLLDVFLRDHHVQLATSPHHQHRQHHTSTHRHLAPPPNTTPNTAANNNNKTD